MSWGLLYQVKWLTVVKDFLYLRVNPHRHLNFHVFHQELTSTTIENKAVFLRRLASSTRNTRNGVLHIWEGYQDEDAQGLTHVYDSVLLPGLLVTSQCPCHKVGPVLCFYRWNWGEICLWFPHLIWILTDPPSSLLFLPAGQIQTIQWRTLKFRASCPIELSGMMEVFYSAPVR